MFRQRLNAILLFYRNFWLFSNGVTLGLVWAGAPQLTAYFPVFIAYFFWFKLLSCVGIWLLIRRIKQPQFWFYHNLGFSELTLFGGAFGLDGLITTGIISLTYLILSLR